MVIAAYERKKAREAAKTAKAKTYTTDGGTRVYDTATGDLISSTTKGIRLPDQPTLPNQGGKASVTPDISSLLSTSRVAVDRDQIEKEVKLENKPAMDRLRKSFDMKLDDVQGLSRDSQRALGGQLGTNRRSSDSAKNFISYVDNEYKKKIAALELQKEDAIEAADAKMLQIINSRIADERAAQQAEIDNAIKLFDLQAKINKQQSEDPFNIANREGSVISLYQQGVEDPAEIFSYINYDDEGNQVGDVSLEEITKTLDKFKTDKEQIDNLIVDLGKAGAPAEVIRKASQSRSLTEAVTSAGDYLVSGSGIVGEYQFYKRDAISRGIVPVSFDQYQNVDANRKKSIAAAANASGLPNTVVTQIDKISSSFDSSPIVKQYNEVLNKKMSVDAILEAGVGGPGDLALVFEFMKALDPTSVVRETEYENAAKSGNIFRGVFAKYNGYFKSEGGFLPATVKSGFQALVDSKLGAIQKQYDNLRNEKARLINQKTGSQDGTNYLIDYSTGVTSKVIDQGVQAKTKVETFLETSSDEGTVEAVANLYEAGKDDIAVYEWLKLRGKVK